MESVQGSLSEVFQFAATTPQIDPDSARQPSAPGTHVSSCPEKVPPCPSKPSSEGSGAVIESPRPAADGTATVNVSESDEAGVTEQHETTACVLDLDQIEPAGEDEPTCALHGVTLDQQDELAAKLPRECAQKLAARQKERQERAELWQQELKAQQQLWDAAPGKVSGDVPPLLEASQLITADPLPMDAREPVVHSAEGHRKQGSSMRESELVEIGERQDRESSGGSHAISSRVACEEVVPVLQNAATKLFQSEVSLSVLPTPLGPLEAQPGDEESAEATQATADLAQELERLREAEAGRQAALAAQTAAAEQQFAEYAVRVIAARRVQRGWWRWCRSEARRRRHGAIQLLQRAARVWLLRLHSARAVRVACARTRVRSSAMYVQSTHNGCSNLQTLLLRVVLFRDGN